MMSKTDGAGAAPDPREAHGSHELWRVVFPFGDCAPDKAFARRAMPVYAVEPGNDAEAGEGTGPYGWVTGRRTISVPAGSTLSTACYYNAFPAAYWAQWTNVEDVELRLRVTGDAVITVKRSDSHARASVIAEIANDDTARPKSITVLVDITGMKSGGWLWFEVRAGSGPAEIADAAWCATASPKRDMTASLAITTMNKPEWCIRQFDLLAHAADLNLIDAVYVVDQGTKLVRDEAGFEQADQALGGRLHIIRQGNVGGSGGFARGMHEVERRGDSGYALLLDDDTVLEPESISRAIAFANHCLTPTLVGGNMLFLSEPTRLCALAETFNDQRVFWQTAPGTPKFDDLAARPFIDSTYLHRRADADYNAWWMCLIPVETIRNIGLAFPFFIKNDDVEYGVRAKRAGYRTVTVPGVCLWHQSWMDKDDILDWQAYYHVRNKLIMGLLYSNRPWGGGLFAEMTRASASAAVKMRYSAVRLHQMAVRDVLQGAEHIGDILETRLPQIRATRDEEPDTHMQPLEDLPNTLRVHSRAQADQSRAAKGAMLHQITPPRRDAATVIDGYVEPMKAYWAVDDAASGATQTHDVAANGFDGLDEVASNAQEHWRVMGHMDSAVFVNRERGTGILLRRRPFKETIELVKAFALYGRLALQWRKYQSAYRKEFATLVSPSWWSRYFHG